MHLVQPDVLLGVNDAKMLLLTKTNIVSLKKDDEPCSDDPDYDIKKCRFVTVSFQICNQILHFCKT